MKRISLSLLLFLFQYVLNAFTLSGYIADEAGNSLPFVNVMIKGTTKGCISNENGYYSLDLSSGEYEIIYKYIGYAQEIQKVTIEGKSVKLNVKMGKTTLDLKEVVIDGNAEDPAYRIIREAQKKRKYYLEQVNAYSCDVYIKDLERFTKLPKNILGFKTEDILDESEKWGLDSNGRGILYLSESVSKLYFRQPDKIKEEMISSKVSGDNQVFSDNWASDFLLTFYENTLKLADLSERDFISPISSGAFLYYRYKLEGTFMENGLLVNKIQVIPRRKNDPVFRGYIYIIEDTWNIHSVNLYLTKDAQIDFVDSFAVQQIYSKIENDVWMIVSNKYLYNWSSLGAKGEGINISFQSNYILNPDFPKGFFGPEEMRIIDDANKKDSVYWKDTRPVTLTDEEKKDYHLRDSMMVATGTKEYKDSVDKKLNHFNIGNFIFKGYKYSNTYKKYELYFSLNIFDSNNFNIPNVNYNTVEGWNISPYANYFKYFDNNKSYYIGGNVGYGFGNTHFNWGAWVNYDFRPQHFSSISFSIGKDVTQFNSGAIAPIFNSIYTLFCEQNYMKLYENQGASIEYRTELKNGIYLNTDCSYNDRIPLNNSQTWVIKDYPERQITSNNPQYPDSSGFPFERNQALILDIGFRFSIKQKYYTEPNRKVVLGSKYPEFRINYKKGLGDVNFDLVKAGVSKKINMKLFGVFKFDVSCGSFLNKKKLYFMDYKHIYGNQTIFLQSINNGQGNSSVMGFNLLPYYKYSTTSNFIEAHAEHHFKGWFINKIPLLRKTRIHEVAGIHYLSTKEINQYVEVTVGVENIGYFRIDFITAFNSGNKITNGFRIGFVL